MRLRIEIDVKQEKHGELIVKLNGLSIGELSDLDPMDEINKLSDVVKAREIAKDLPELRKILDEAIIHRLAILMAWYYTE